MWSRRRSCFLTTRRGLELSFSYMVKVYWFMESNGPLDLFYPLGSSDLFQGSITYSKYFPRAFHLNSIVLHCNSIQFYYKKKLHNVGLLQKISDKKIGQSYYWWWNDKFFIRLLLSQFTIMFWNSPTNVRIYVHSGKKCMKIWSSSHHQCTRTFLLLDSNDTHTHTHIR